MLQQHVEDRAADVMDEPLVTDHSQNGKIEFHEDSDEVDTSLFPRTKAGTETAAPVELQQNQLRQEMLWPQKHSRADKKIATLYLIF